jgi:hypothetical protein
VTPSPPPIAERDKSLLEKPSPAMRPANGGPAAALLAAGLACSIFGVLVAVAEVFKEWGSAYLAVSAGVGPLSGEAMWAAGAYLMLWTLLHVLLRNRIVRLWRWMLASIVLTGIGVALTFPPIYQALG